MTLLYVFHNDAEKGALILHPYCGENSGNFWPVFSGPSMNCSLFVSFSFPYVKLLPQVIGSIEWDPILINFEGYCFQNEETPAAFTLILTSDRIEKD